MATTGSFPEKELVVSGVFPKVRIVEEEGYPKILLSTLLEQSTAILNGVQPYHYWDFTQDKALFAQADVGATTSTPNWSFTRATTANYHNANGTLTSFGSGVPRIGSRGLLVEVARTNLFLNSDTGATQNVTVTAAAHTLSFYGTGTITLSGVSTAGPLVGTGANTRVSLNFTPTAGVLTLTVSGTCTNVQLELGTGASSYISTAGAAVTRNADVAIVTTPGVVYPMSLWVEYEVFAVQNAGSTLLRTDNGTNNERGAISLTVGNVPRFQVATGGVSQGDIQIGSAVTVGSIYKHGAVAATNRIQAAVNGTLGTEDTVATMPTNPTTLRFGSNESGVSQPGVFIRRAAVFNSALTDTQLRAITNI